MTVRNISLNASPLGRIFQSGCLFLVMLTLVSLPVFWTSLVSLGTVWITPEYSHGPLIPLISLYLFLRELRDKSPVFTSAEPDRRPGFLLVILSLLLAVLGNVVSVPDIVSYSLILWVSGVVLMSFGWTEGRRHQMPVLHLVFMLPLPQILYWKLTIFLQGVSSELGVWFIKMAEIPVYLDGNIIDLGPYKLQVAEACSGLRYLFPILSFSYLMAILYRGPYSHKVFLFLLAAPLTVFMNAFRIGVIGMLVNSYGIEQADGFLHFFEGWVIFGACIGLLFLTALLLQWLNRTPKTLSETIDLDFQGLGPQFTRVLQMPNTSTLFATFLVCMVISASFLLFPRPESNMPMRDNFALFPRQLGSWSGSFEALDPDVAEVLGASDYVNSVYSSPEAEAPVEFFAAWYHSQTEGEGIHSPEVCLPNGGWEIYSLQQHEVSMPETIYGTFTVNKGIIEKGLQRQLVYYWFEQRGVRMTNDVAAKFSVLRDTITRGRSDGAMVRFVTRINARETETEASKRLEILMHHVLKSLPSYIPE